jgi:hypothetical protein
LDGVEILVVLNTSRAPIAQNVEVDALSANWRSLHGACPAVARAPGAVAVEVAPLDYILCISERS